MPSHSTLDKPALAAAFADLQTYDYGSSRAKLLPIDEAVAASLRDDDARKDLERRLIAAIASNRSVVAREYICSKLALIGTSRCISSLESLLRTPGLSTAARNVLEAIPHRGATKILQRQLPKAQGAEKVGIINSLGARRDPDSARMLSALLNDADANVIAAAVAALGEIGSMRAAAILRKFQSKASPSLQGRVMDASLVCAERLLAANRKAAARAMYEGIFPASQPRHIQSAIARGLARAKE